MLMKTANSIASAAAQKPAFWGTQKRYYDFKSWRAQLNFKNLTDTEFEGRGVGSASVITADPFAVFVSIGFQR